MNLGYSYSSPKLVYIHVKHVVICDFLWWTITTSWWLILLTRILWWIIVYSVQVATKCIVSFLLDKCWLIKVFITRLWAPEWNVGFICPFTGAWLKIKGWVVIGLIKYPGMSRPLSVSPPKYIPPPVTKA